MVSIAFSPCGISSFFEICDTNLDGTPISKPEEVGSRGGGFALSKGVTTEVHMRPSESTEIEIYINEKKVEAITTQTVVNTLLHPLERKFYVKVQHRLEVPIGSGFGTSAAGALSCALALSHGLGLNLTYNKLASVAHVADVVCQTGLGTVAGLTVGGLVLIVKSGTIGIGLVDRIPIPSNLKIVAGSFKPIEKRSVLLSPEKRSLINTLGRETLTQILAEPTLVNFFKSCKAFAFRSGLASKRVKSLILAVEVAGAIGATQNMIGEAVHAVTTLENLDRVYDTFRISLPKRNIIISDIDFQGARLLSS
jgi:pantoate kinase